MIHPHTEVRFIDDEKGHGLFATRFIPKGTITWVRDELDREISPSQLQQYKQPLRDIIFHYSYRNNKGNFIFCWDNTRYMNHDCNPNSLPTPYNLELAVRDIEAGEEITNHYGALNIVDPFTPLGCEDIVVRSDDLRRYAPQWDVLLCSVFPLIKRCSQPLRSFITESDWLEIEKIADGRSEIKSLITCLFDESRSDCIME